MASSQALSSLLGTIYPHIISLSHTCRSLDTMKIRLYRDREAMKSAFFILEIAANIDLIVNKCTLS